MKNVISKIWGFFTGFFRDQNGETSSKRITLYVLLFILNKIVNNSIDKKDASDYLVYGIFITILFCLGAITSEFFKKDSTDLKLPDKDTNSTTPPPAEK